MVQPQSDATSRESQNQSTEGAAVESKKVQVPDKPAREKKRSIFKKPIQMPGRGDITEQLMQGLCHNDKLMNIELKLRSGAFEQND